MRTVRSPLKQREATCRVENRSWPEAGCQHKHPRYNAASQPGRMIEGNGWRWEKTGADCHLRLRSRAIRARLESINEHDAIQDCNMAAAYAYCSPQATSELKAEGQKQRML